jgi:hypothetical protein
MASPQDSPKPDLGSLRIQEDQRGKSATRKRAVYASIPVIIFGAIVGGLLPAIRASNTSVATALREL